MMYREKVFFIYGIKKIILNKICKQLSWTSTVNSLFLFMALSFIKTYNKLYYHVDLQTEKQKLHHYKPFKLKNTQILFTK